MDDHRIDAGLAHQHDILREVGRNALLTHGIPAILHDDRLLVVFQDEGKCLCQHTRRGAPLRLLAQVLHPLVPSMDDIFFVCRAHR